MSSKSTFKSSTANSYAVALYELANENSELDKVENEMKNIKKLLNENSDFNEIISSPIVGKDEKKNVLLSIADKCNFSMISKKFLGFVAIKNRLFFLNKIIENFLNLVSYKKGEIKAKLMSSKKLSIEEQKKIQQELSEEFKSPIKIDYKYDPDLIAGLIFQIGSVMIDTSIKSKLKQLEKSMVEV